MQIKPMRRKKMIRITIARMFMVSLGFGGASKCKFKRRHYGYYSTGVRIRR